MMTPVIFSNFELFFLFIFRFKNKICSVDAVTESYETWENICEKSYEEREATGHQLCDIILECYFKGVPCDFEK